MHRRRNMQDEQIMWELFALVLIVGFIAELIDGSLGNGF